MKKIIEKYIMDIKQIFIDLKVKEKRKQQIPNLLTLSRLLSPLFILPCAIFNNYLLASIFIVIFSLTDLFDGYFARKYNCVTELGKDLDAITDKVYTSTLLLALALSNLLLMPTLIIEFLIAVVNINYKLKNRNPITIYIGKVKTAVLYLYLTILFLAIYFEIYIWLQVTIGIITIILQILTLISYIKLMPPEKTATEKINI